MSAGARITHALGYAVGRKLVSQSFATMAVPNLASQARGWFHRLFECDAGLVQKLINTLNWTIRPNCGETVRARIGGADDPCSKLEARVRLLPSIAARFLKLDEASFSDIEGRFTGIRSRIGWCQAPMTVLSSSMKSANSRLRPKRGSLGSSIKKPWNAWEIPNKLPSM